jgi:HSP20 family molecular chaperone IbpA
MIKKQCNQCGKKIKKKFDYCPWCGHSFRVQKEKANFGMLGREDRQDGNMLGNELKLPFGLNKVMGSLMKQLESELGNMNQGQQPPRGFKIQLSTGMPGQLKPQPIIEEKPKIEKEEVPERERKRRVGLPKIEADSKLKRIGDEIIIELEVPGIKSKKDIEFDVMEGGTGIRAYTKEACYIKVLPVKQEGLQFSVKKDRVIVESKR